VRQTLGSEALVRRRILLLPVLVAALLAISTSAAQAGSFILTLSGDGIAVPLTIADPTPGSSPDQVVYSGVLGGFTVTIVGTATYPGATSPLQMNFGTMSVRNNSSGPATFQATLWRQGLSASSLGLGSTVIGLGSAGATTGGVGTVSFASYIDASNGTLGQAVFNSTIPGGPLNATSGPVNLVSGQDFSIGTIVNFSFTGAGLVTASSGLQVRDSAVPEPTTLLLFGPGFAGLAAYRRRRRSTTR
jgi:hypothetical protein